MKSSLTPTLIALCAGLFLFGAPSAAQVNVIEAPLSLEYFFMDIGYDSATNEVAMVGFVGPDVPTVFGLNAAGDGFVAQALANLPGATSNALVLGMSSDASRIAGASSSTNSIDLEGATWLRSNPTVVEGIGFLEGYTNNSGASAAWSDGVVGSTSGNLFPITWSNQNGIEVLPGAEGGNAEAQGVSANGEISAGVATFEVFGGAAYYWDSSGIHRLDDVVEGFSTINSVARVVSPDGNFIGGEIVLLDSSSEFTQAVAVWAGPEKELTVLTDSNGDIISGVVNDVSDAGYVVGVFSEDDPNNGFEAFGYIWHPDFETSGQPGVRLFDQWLLDEFGFAFPFANPLPFAIASGNGKMFFPVAGFDNATGEATGIALVEVDEAGVLLGDINCDGVVDLLDVAPFVELLTTGGFSAKADLNSDGEVNLLDVAPFVDAIAGG